SGNASFSVGKFCELLGPAAAQGLIKLDDGEELVEFGLGERILGREKLLLGFQNFVVTGFARNVALGGDRDRLLVRGHRARLLDTDGFQFFAGHERISHIVEGAQRSLLVLEFGLLQVGFGLLVLPVPAAALKDRAGNVRSNRPGTGATRGNRRQIRTNTTVKGGQADSGKKITQSNPDAGIGGAHKLFRSANIGPALQQLGGQTGRDFRRQSLPEQCGRTRDGTWVAAEKDIDLIFFDDDTALQFWNDRGGGSERRRGGLL